MTNPFALQGKRTLKNKPCEPLQPNSPSCGNQPANIRIDTASNASTRSPPPTTRFGQPKRAPRDDGHQAPASPCPLDKTPYISVRTSAPVTEQNPRSMSRNQGQTRNVS